MGNGLVAIDSEQAVAERADAPVTAAPTPAAASNGAAPAPAPPSLRRAMMRGSFWVFVAYGAGNALRLISSLVLTRLLNSQIYGEMVVPGVVMIGLQMFSDIGAGPAIIRDPRGDDPRFLNTAWTMQACRGLTLWLMSCILAWPLSVFYQQPSLVWLLPGVGLTAAIQGFNSTRLFQAQRHLQLGRLTLVELMQHMVTVVVQIAIAVRWMTPWALVIGGVAGAAARMWLSHVALPGSRNRFDWDRTAYHALFHFGKWIFLASIVFFLAKQGDRLLLSAYVAMSLMGVYYIATQLGEAATSIIMQLSRNVLFSGLSRVTRERREELGRSFYKARLRMDVLFLPAIGVGIAAGVVPVELLYRREFWWAGWMLQFLCVQAATLVFLEPCEQCIVALGGSKIVFLTHLVRAGWVLGGMPVAWHLGTAAVGSPDLSVQAIGGIAGVLTVIATSEFPVGVVYWYVLRKQRILNILLEARSAAILAGGVLLGLGVERVWEVIRPLVRH